MHTKTEVQTKVVCEEIFVFLLYLLTYTYMHEMKAYTEQARTNHTNGYRQIVWKTVNLQTELVYMYVPDRDKFMSKFAVIL